jgi:rare lipoprotein A
MLLVAGIVLASALGVVGDVAGAAPAHRATGQATWYIAPAHGQYPAARVCSSATLRFGTVVTIRNLHNGRVATCVVGDRKPFNAVRLIDLSTGVFTKLAPLGAGVIPVSLTW